MIEVAFWMMAGTIAYVYIGYPLLLVVLSRIAAKPVHKAPTTPSVSILVAAYNEAAVIQQKIRNVLSLDYPRDRLEIVIASDGSTDRTAELAAELADGDTVRVIAYPRNRGKVNVLNDSVPSLRGDIVVFSDATSMLEPKALRTLVESFADPNVGGVSGVYKVRRHDQAQLGASEDLYWRYETFLKMQEASVGSILGGHGSLYAIRKTLYSFPAAGTINDDFVIALGIIQRGYRMAYEPGAVAFEEAVEMGGFSRRVRIMTGNVQQCFMIRSLVRPLRWAELGFFLSHKAGRMLVPFCMLGLAVINAALLGLPFYRMTAALQGCFYGLAAAGGVWKLNPKLLRLPFYFTMINAAVFIGIFMAVRGGRVEWKRA